MESEQKFQECIRDVNRKKKCEEKIADLEKQLRYLHSREERHKAGMEKALANADKLAGVSLSALLVETNSPSSALNENRRNAYKEAINYESIVSQIKAVEADLAVERTTLASLEGAEERCAQISAEYKAFCQERDPEYLEIQHRIAEYESNKTIIRMVVEACKSAQQYSDQAYAEMQKKRQIMKKRFSFTSAKKKQIDATQKSIEELQIAVRRFTNELAKVQDMPDSGPIRDERFLKFADYFFEDIFLFPDEEFDMSVALGKIEMVRWTLEEAGNNLAKVLGMASLVESRDNSTGGHIRRTSMVVSIFSKKIAEYQDKMQLSNCFLKMVEKAAPMHDLGKLFIECRPELEQLYCELATGQS